MKSDILIVEDDNYINNLIRDALETAGYNCIQAFSGTEGILRVQTGSADLVILDLMLPGKSGEEVIRDIKKIRDIPVIVVSAKDSVDSKIELLKLGADDYLTKPFDIKELEVRVEVRLRRYYERQRLKSLEAGNEADLTSANNINNLNVKDINKDGNNQNNIRVGIDPGTDTNFIANSNIGNGHIRDLGTDSDYNSISDNIQRTADRCAGSIFYKEIELNPENYFIKVNNNPVDLTKHEFRIMELLIKNPDKAFSKQAIYDYAWDDVYIGEDKTINVHISNIRKKLKVYTDTDYIDTVWGIGFKLAR